MPRTASARTREPSPGSAAEITSAAGLAAPSRSRASASSTLPAASTAQPRRARRHSSASRLRGCGSTSSTAVSAKRRSVAGPAPASWPAGQSSGTSTQKVAPRPCRLSTPISPSISPTRRLQIASPRPVPPNLARRRGVGLRKHPEQPVEPVGGNADSGVADLEAVEAGVLAPGPDAHDDLSRRRELDRVVDQVGQDLAQPDRVAVQPLRDLGVDDRDQLELPPLRGRGQQGHRLLDDRGRRDLDRFQLEPAGLDPREVEEVVDDRQEARSGQPHDLGALGLLGREVGLEQQVRHPDHAIHRRPDLVAHGGQQVGSWPARPSRPGRARRPVRSSAGPARRAPGPARRSHRAVPPARASAR